MTDVTFPTDASFVHLTAGTVKLFGVDGTAAGYMLPADVLALFGARLTIGTIAGTAGDGGLLATAVSDLAAAQGTITTLSSNVTTLQTQFSLTLLKANNLSELTSPGVARANLGLGNAATLNVGVVAGTVAAGDDPRLVGAGKTPVTNTYTASGAIATTDSFALINSATAVAMTLAAGAVPDFGMIINNFGAGVATVTLNLQGSVQSIPLSSGNVLNIVWNAVRSTYLLIS